jgi:integrase
MTRQTTHLTTELIEALRPGERVYDDIAGCKGLYVAAGKSVKRFGLHRDYPKQFFDGKSVEVSVGRYPEMSLKAARTRADKFRLMIKQGVNPKTERAPALLPMLPADEDTDTTVIFSNAWLKDRRPLFQKKVAAGERSAKTLKNYDECYARLAPWHGMTLRAIFNGRIGDKSLIRAMHESLSDSPVAANQALAFFRKLYISAAADSDLQGWKEGRFDRNPPCRTTVEKLKARIKELDLEKDDLAGYLKIWNAERLKIPDWRKRLLLLLALTTGARKSDLLNLRWEHVNLEKRTVHFVAPKGNRVSRPKDYVVPLCSLAHWCLCQLDAANRFPYNVLVFPTKRGAFMRPTCSIRGGVAIMTQARKIGPMSWPKLRSPKSRILRSPHILRSALITIAENVEGLSDAQRCAMSNHKIPGARGHYVGDISTVAAAFRACGEVIERAICAA